jgi:hypothetical protein
MLFKDRLISLAAVAGISCGGFFVENTHSWLSKQFTTFHIQ